MATNLTQTTFLSEYNDDYRDSDHYHRILFNNGRALQARELTQSQTIIQSEIERISKFLFKEGGFFNNSYGSLSGAYAPVGFVKITDDLVSLTGYATLVGTTITSSAAGVTALVKAVIPATGSDPDTLLVKYKSSNNTTSATTNTTPKIFEPADTLSYDTGTISGTLTVQTTNTASNPATGKAAFIEVPEFSTFAAGHIVSVNAQSLIISKYSSTPTETIGYTLSEKIITAADNIALYDNSGTTPNLTSPGADRYQITLTLSKESDKAAGETFYPIMQIKNGYAVYIQPPDNVLGELGIIVNTRTSDINGNFIVNNDGKGSFGLVIDDDSDDDYLLYKVDGGVAYVQGNRIERTANPPIRVKKPRTAADDTFTINDEVLRATYGNYFLSSVDSSYGLVGKIATLANVNLYGSRIGDNGGVINTLTPIGTARIRNVDETDNQYKIHVFDVSMDSNGSGTLYGIGQARSIGTDSANYANLTTSNESLGIDLYNRFDNSLLFPFQKERVNIVEDVSVNLTGIITTTTNGAGEATFTEPGGFALVNQEDWIVSVDSSGELFSPPTVSSFPSASSAVVTGLPFNSAVTALVYKNKPTAVQKTKTLQTSQTESVSLTNGTFKLSKADIWFYRSVVDDTTSEDITYKFILHNGQTDNYYGVGHGRLKSGVEAPTGTVTVTYDYFSHNAGDYFAGALSYPDLDYFQIPFHATQTGQVYPLSDVIDMRPVKNAADTGFTGTGAVIEDIPKNTDIITAGSISYWEPRVDAITMGVNGIIKVVQSKSGYHEKPEGINPGDMKLHLVGLPPYVFDKREVLQHKYPNKGYKMADIANIENRVNNLEVISALTIAEMQLMQLTVSDPNDATLPDRVKLGITGDTFKSNLQSDAQDIDFRAYINTQAGEISPVQYARSLPMKYDSDQSLTTVLKGDTVWPKYSEEVMIDQSVASKAINVNQFDPAKVVGAGELKPEVDQWNTGKRVDPNYQIKVTQPLCGGVGTGTFVASQGSEITEN